MKTCEVISQDGRTVELSRKENENLLSLYTCELEVDFIHLFSASAGNFPLRRVDFLFIGGCVFSLGSVLD